MEKFHDIESLRHIITEVKTYADYIGKPLDAFAPVTFRGTVKLHGTNAGVRVDDGILVTPQGRNRALSIQDDNYGFALFTLQRRDEFLRMAGDVADGHTLTFYGEWCGKGIQSKVGVSNLPRMFVIFAIKDHTTDSWISVFDLNLDTNDVAWWNNQNIYFITQVPTYVVTVDWLNPTPAAELISKYTLQVEDACPFANSKLFGAYNHGENIGIGEGIVWSNDGDILIDGQPWMSDGQKKRLTFKSKGEKHKKTEKTHVPVDPEKVKAISELVDLLLPEWRLEQGFQFLRESNLPIANTSTGQYLKWVMQDILKEESDRIAANEFTWKEIQGQVTNRARKFFSDHLDAEAGLPSARSEVPA